MSTLNWGLASLAAGAAALVVASVATPAEAGPRFIPHGGGFHGGGFHGGWAGGGFRPGGIGYRPVGGFRPGYGYRPGGWQNANWRPGYRPGWNGGYWRPGWGYRPIYGGGYWGGGWGGCGYWGNCGWGPGAAAAAGVVGGLAIAAAANNYNNAYYADGYGDNNCAYVKRKVFISGVGWRWTKRLECDY
jgi:hypothetical protein